MEVLPSGSDKFNFKQPSEYEDSRRKLPKVVLLLGLMYLHLMIILNDVNYVYEVSIRFINFLTLFLLGIYFTSLFDKEINMIYDCFFRLIKHLKRMVLCRLIEDLTKTIFCRLIEHLKRSAFCRPKRPLVDLSNGRFDINPTICEDTKESGTGKSKDVSVALNSNVFRQRHPECLQYFLEDATGARFLQKYLVQQHYDITFLYFYFACRGLKKMGPIHEEKCLKVSHLMYRRQVKKISAISSTTKHEIERKLRSNTGVNIHIFDKAQREVEEYVLTNIFPKFLRSKVYRKCLTQRKIIIGNEVKLKRRLDTIIESTEDLLIFK